METVESHLVNTLDEPLMDQQQTSSIQHKPKPKAGHNQNINSKERTLEQHRHSANIEESSFEKNQQKANRVRCQKEFSPESSLIFCPICSETFEEIAFLIEHLRLHQTETQPDKQSIPDANPTISQPENDELTCIVCGKFCSSKKALRRHLLCHDDRPFKCDICESSFSVRSELLSHSNRHHLEESRQTRASCEETAIVNTDRISNTEESDEAEQKCDICKKSFSLKKELNKHLKTHRLKAADEFAEKCEKEILEADIQISNNEERSCEQDPSATNTFNCAGCQKVFVGEKPKVCDSCQKEFPQRSNCRPNLKGHISNRKMERPYSCQECEKSFTLEFHLKRHLRIHSNKTRNKDNLQTHLEESAHNTNVKKIKVETNIHVSHMEGKALEEQPNATNAFTCNNCKKIFLGEKPQACDNCCTEFSRQPDEDVESLSVQHHSNENYVCAVCGKHFNFKRQLTGHLRCHSKGKHFKCDVCEKSFSTPQRLNQHVKNHASEKYFFCEGCGISFFNKRDLTRHLTGISLASLIHLINIKKKKKNLKTAIEDILKKHNETADLKEKSAKENATSNVEKNALDKPAPTINTYACKVCQKEFVGEKPAACDKCKTELPENANLGVDIACQPNEKASGDISSDVAKFKCFFCSRAFSQINCLQAHVLCHTAEKVTCGLCGGSFTHISTLYVHLRLHIGKKQYKCDQCDRSFVTKSHLDTHLRAHSEEKPFLCEICGKCFKYKITYNFHHRIHHPSNHAKTKRPHTRKRPFECQICHERFFTNFRLMKHQCAASSSRNPREKCSCRICGKKLLKYSLKYHLLSHSRNKEFKCEICGKLFTSKLYLHKHLPIHSEEKPFPCKICGDKFSTSKLLSVHRRKHYDAKPFECEVCHKRFFTNFYLKNHRCEAPSSQKTTERRSCLVCGKEMSKTHLKKHLLLHSGERPFKCEVCGRSFPCKLYLNKHLPIHSAERPFPCEICGKRYVSKKHLSDHRRHHSNKKQRIRAKHLTCEFCPKKFSCPSTLKEHVRIHSGERPFTCDICQRSFTQRGNLNSHRLHHEGVKAFLCEQCPKAFYTTGELNRHQQICNGEKPFQCEFCHKAFRTSSYLCLHRRVHTGEKPFICKVCNKSFLGSTHLKRHMRIHTGERPYQCHVCQKGFSQRYNLKIHLRTHNRQEPASSGSPNLTSGHGAPTSSCIPNRSYGRDAALSPSVPNHPHGREASMPSNVPNLSNGRDGSLLTVLSRTLTVDAPMSSFLQSSAASPDVHATSGIPNHPMSGQANVIQTWYY